MEALDAVFDGDRLRRLHELALLDSPTEEAFDRLTRLACRMLGAPISLISLVDDHRQFFKSEVGLGEPWASARETGHGHSFCKHVVASGKRLVVSDARLDPMLRDNLAIRDMNAIAYCGLPLTTSEGFTLGSFCVIGHEPRAWTDDEVMILEDLKAFVMAEIELRSRTHELQRESAAKTQLMSVVSHEFRTPLTGIQGFSEMLRDEDLAQSEVRDYAATINAEARRLGRMVTDILDLHRIENGQLTLVMQSCDLNAIVRETVALVGVGATGHRIEVDLDPTLVAITGDDDTLRRVLVNLVNNAVKYSPAGGTIRVSTRREPPVAHLRVEDKGLGIPAQQLEAIFEAYVRVESAATARIEGVGLGLPIVRQIVEKHDGAVWAAQNADGVGSTFHVTLPLERPST